MSYTYKNSKGTTYVLRSRQTTLKNGLRRTLYYFAREQDASSTEAVPAGYRVVETETGAPVLVKGEENVVSEPTSGASGVFSPAIVLEESTGEQDTSGFLPGQTSVEDLLAIVKQGVPFSTFGKLYEDLGISKTRLSELLGIEPSTLQEREDADRFTPQESERIIRYVLLMESATRLFGGDREQAVAWLSRRRTVLQNQTPLDYATTEIGAREVEDLIGRLEHGVFA